PMEYAVVRIHREEETKANSIPKASTLSCNGAPGMTSTMVNTSFWPPSTAGSMDRTMANFKPAAKKLTASRVLGLRAKMIKGTAQSEVRTAKRGNSE
ncbi:MAG: hypothetical protein DRH15_07955, partial [Deltaproteobacteria bacterium]